MIESKPKSNDAAEDEFRVRDDLPPSTQKGTPQRAWKESPADHLSQFTALQPSEGSFVDISCIKY